MTQQIFDEETWAQLPDFIENLPEPVHLTMWGDEEMSAEERNTAVLLRTLADRFENITFEILPRRVNYPYYPVIGVMGVDGGIAPQATVDFGVRIIGQPAGMQMTTLIAAMQAVSFRGQTLEPLTRIKLKQLDTAVHIEILTAADVETGAVVAKHAFGLAVASEHIRALVIMADQFQEALIRYSVNYLPHVVVNGRVHSDGVIEEDELLKQVALAVK
jgi:alkyl hydroperoxide reductase subunit AhpF